MIEFKEKLYVAPLIPVIASVVGSLGVEAGLGAKNNKNQKESLEEQERIQRQMQKDQKRYYDEQLKIQRQAVAEGISPTAEAKEFSFINPATIKNLSGAVKGVWKVSHTGGRNLTKTLVHGTVMGAGMAGAGYAANKIIEKDQEKSAKAEEKVPEEKTYAAVPVGAIRSGLKSIAPKAGGYLKKVGGYAKESLVDVLSPLKRNAKTGKLGLNGSAMFTYGLGAGVPVMGYISQKKQAKNQVEATAPAEEERTYAAIPIGGIKAAMKSFVPRAQRFVKAPLTQTGNGISKFMGAGIDKTASFGKDLAEFGRKSGNTYLQKGGDFIENSMKRNAKGRLSTKGKLVLGGATVVGSTVMFKPWEVGEKATKKALGAVDKNAYAYEKSQEQGVE